MARALPLQLLVHEHEPDVTVQVLQLAVLKAHEAVDTPHEPLLLGPEYVPGTHVAVAPHQPHQEIWAQLKQEPKETQERGGALVGALVDALVGALVGKQKGLSNPQPVLHENRGGAAAVPTRHALLAPSAHQAQAPELLTHAPQVVCKQDGGGASGQADV